MCIIYILYENAIYIKMFIYLLLHDLYRNMHTYIYAGYICEIYRNFLYGLNIRQPNLHIFVTQCIHIYINYMKEL